MALTLNNLDYRDEVKLREIADVLLRQDKKIGGYSIKVDARQTGFSMHVKFERKTDVFTTMEVAKAFEQSGEILFLIVSKLLDLPIDYDPDAEKTE